MLWGSTQTSKRFCTAFTHKVYISQQTTYLIDEAFNVGKGATAIISKLHHFFIYGFGERGVHLHADDCVGQKKNRFVMYNLMWNAMADLHDEATISYLPVWHIKFSPDRCFSLMKQCFCRTRIGILNDIANCVSLGRKIGWNSVCSNVQLERALWWHHDEECSLRNL